MSEKTNYGIITFDVETLQASAPGVDYMVEFPQGTYRVIVTATTEPGKWTETPRVPLGNTLAIAKTARAGFVVIAYDPADPHAGYVTAQDHPSRLEFRIVLNSGQPLFIAGTSSVSSVVVGWVEPVFSIMWEVAGGDIGAGTATVTAL